MILRTQSSVVVLQRTWMKGILSYTFLSLGQFRMLVSLRTRAPIRAKGELDILPTCLMFFRLEQAKLRCSILSPVHSYGFVTFANEDACRRTLEQRKVELGGRMIDVGPAKRRSGHFPQSRSSFPASLDSNDEPVFQFPIDNVSKIFHTALHV